MELKYSEKLSVVYHSLFHFPLNKNDLIKWECRYKKIKNFNKVKIKKHGEFYYVGESKEIIKRLNNNKSSLKKYKIAKSASNIISLIPSVLFVGITGSLAMNNANKDSDIDLIIVTKKDTLWLTRPLVYLFLIIKKVKIRKPNTNEEKDRLCLNMWIDELNLVWDEKQRNIFTAHEMAQIVPLINRNKTYEKIMYLNRWILDYWPNSILNIDNNREDSQRFFDNRFLRFINKACMFIQYVYMKNKQTREYVSEGKAFFHPINNSMKVVKAFEKLYSTH
jgi:predicted nucleotidyltransferase